MFNQEPPNPSTFNGIKTQTLYEIIIVALAFSHGFMWGLMGTLFVLLINEYQDDTQVEGQDETQGVKNEMNFPTDPR